MTTLTLRTLRINSSSLNGSTFIQRNSQFCLSPSPLSILSSRRYASSNAPAAEASSSRSRVNGPLSTLPPPIKIPTREPGQSFFRYAFATGKTYLGFYKTGGKAVFTNFMAARPIQVLVDKNHNGVLSDAVFAKTLDRYDFQLLVRSWFDVKRVPLFALVFAVCGEFTPFVVIFITSVVPYTCRIPKQIENDLKKLESRRSISFRNLTKPYEDGSGVNGLERMQLLHISWSLGLSSGAWDWLGGQLPGPPNVLLRRKVTRRVEYLKMDDALICRDGGVGEMDTEEVKLALVERGIDVLGKNDEQLRGSLEAWLEARDRSPVEELLLTRPSVW